jgi:N-acetylmuramoyl-L-alanine amidase
MYGDTPSSRRAVLALIGTGLGVVWLLPRGAQAATEVARAPKPRSAPPKRRLRTIMLDPGHGGADPGAVGKGGRYEKTIVLGFARELERRLEATGRYRVVMTRRGDTFVALRERVARARAAKAELFLSLHADWHPDGDTRGASVYTLSDEASDRESASLAARENRVDALGGVNLGRQSDQVAQVLFSMAQRGTVNQSRRLAELVVDSFEAQRVGLLPRAHRQAGFAVLTAADIPAALVELGYLSNARDERLLIQRGHQQQLALSLTRAVDRFFNVPVPAPAAKKT